MIYIYIYIFLWYSLVSENKPTLRATKGLPVAALNDDIPRRQELPDTITDSCVAMETS